MFGRRKLLLEAADWASEHQASIAHPKCIGAWHPHPSSARFVGQPRIGSFI